MTGSSRRRARTTDGASEIACGSVALAITAFGAKPLVSGPLRGRMSSRGG